MLIAMLASRSYICYIYTIPSCMVWEYQNEQWSDVLSTAAVLVENDTLIVTVLNILNTSQTTEYQKSSMH